MCTSLAELADEVTRIQHKIEIVDMGGIYGGFARFLLAHHIMEKERVEHIIMVDDDQYVSNRLYQALQHDSPSTERQPQWNAIASPCSPSLSLSMILLSRDNRQVFHFHLLCCDTGPNHLVVDPKTVRQCHFEIEHIEFFFFEPTIRFL